MGHKLIHIATCDCCGRSWQSSSYNKVKDYVDTLALHTSTGNKTLVLCQDCYDFANYTIESLYGSLRAGKYDISLHARIPDYKLVDLDEEV